MQKQTLHIAKFNFIPALLCRILIVLSTLFGSIISYGQLASTLNLDWGKSWGSLQNESGNILKSDSDGNIYMAGVFEKGFTYTISNIEYKTTSFGNKDIFFAKLNINGELVYLQTIGGADNDVLQDMTVDATGNVYLCGNFTNAINLRSTDSTQYHSQEDIDFFVAKYDTRGKCEFARTFGDYGDDICKNIKTDTKGNIFICGYFSDKLRFKRKADQLEGLYSRGLNDVYFVKFNSNGDALWARNFNPNTNSNEESLCMDTDKLGNVYLAGIFINDMDVNTGSKNVKITSIINSKDLYFSKYDSLGNFLFAKTIGNFNLEYVHQLCINQNSDIILAGAFEKELDFNPSFNISNILTSPNGPSGFVAGYSSNGTFKYAQRLPYAGSNNLYAMVTDEQSNIYLTGSFFGEQSFSGFGIKDTMVVSEGNNDIFIAKYGSSGKLKALHTMGGVSNEVPFNICKGLQGKLYVIGTFEDTTTFQIGTSAVKLFSKGKEDIFLLGLSESDANSNQPPFSMSGLVHTGSTFLREGSIALFQLQDTAYVNIQRASILQGAFVFANLSQGTYKLLATPEGDAMNTYEPTYYVNKNNIETSNAITVDGNTYGIDLWMKTKMKSEARKEYGKPSLYPNPLIGEVLSLDFNSNTNGSGLFSIHDLDGKVVFSSEIKLQEGFQQWVFAPTLSNQKLYVAKLFWQDGATEFMLSKQ